MNIRFIIAVSLGAAACSASAARYTESRPHELVGSWVLRRADGTWGDTATWQEDGRMLGSTNHPFPADARWAIRSAEGGERSMCVSGGGQANCQPFVVRADTLIWGRGADADLFRRVVPR